MPNETLILCPFCGDRDIRIVQRHHLTGVHVTASGWAAECGSCPCELSEFSTAEEARKAWNTRAPTY